MRLFIAIRLSEIMKHALISVQNEWFDCGVRGNYTKEENLHLTLAFIGEVPNADAVRDAMEKVQFTPFEIRLNGMGCYGDLWWAGMEESAPLSAVVRRLRRVLAESNVSFDRKRFSPHITLIRKASGEMHGASVPAVSMTVDAISLMRSDRGKNGMIYTEIARCEADGDSKSCPSIK